MRIQSVKILVLVIFAALVFLNYTAYYGFYDFYRFISEIFMSALSFKLPFFFFQRNLVFLAAIY